MEKLDKYMHILFYNINLTLNRWQAIIWTNDILVCWRIYASLGHDELILLSHKLDEFTNENLVHIC